jgi:hypothetical protein
MDAFKKHTVSNFHVIHKRIFAATPSRVMHGNAALNNLVHCVTFKASDLSSQTTAWLPNAFSIGLITKQSAKYKSAVMIAIVIAIAIAAAPSSEYPRLIL